MRGISKCYHLKSYKALWLAVGLYTSPALDSPALASDKYVYFPAKEPSVEVHLEVLDALRDAPPYSPPAVAQAASGEMGSGGAEPSSVVPQGEKKGVFSRIFDSAFSYEEEEEQQAAPALSEEETAEGESWVASPSPQPDERLPVIIRRTDGEGEYHASAGDDSEETIIEEAPAKVAVPAAQKKAASQPKPGLFDILKNLPKKFAGKDEEEASEEKETAKAEEGIEAAPTQPVDVTRVKKLPDSGEEIQIEPRAKTEQSAEAEPQTERSFLSGEPKTNEIVIGSRPKKKSKSLWNVFSRNKEEETKETALAPAEAEVEGVPSIFNKPQAGQDSFSVVNTPSPAQKTKEASSVLEEEAKVSSMASVAPEPVQIVLPNEVDKEEPLQHNIPTPVRRPLGFAEVASHQKPAAPKVKEITVAKAIAAPTPKVEEKKPEIAAPVAIAASAPKVSEEPVVEIEEVVPPAAPEIKISVNKSEDGIVTEVTQEPEIPQVAQIDLKESLPPVLDAEPAAGGEDKAKPVKAESEEKAEGWGSWASSFFSKTEESAEPGKTAESNEETTEGVSKQPELTPPALPKEETVPPMAELAIERPKAEEKPAAPMVVMPAPITPEVAAAPEEEHPVTEKKSEEPATQVASLETKPASADNANGKLARISFSSSEDIEISEDGKRALGALAMRMKEHPLRRIRIVSYATAPEESTSSARRVSLQRAIAIRGLLIDAGVESFRINVQAMGDKPEGDNGQASDSADIFSLGEG